MERCSGLESSLDDFHLVINRPNLFTSQDFIVSLGFKIPFSPTRLYGAVSLKSSVSQMVFLEE